MRIVVNGQQAFGRAVLEALLEDGHEVVAAYCRTEPDGTPPDPLRRAAAERGIPVFQPRSFRDPEVHAQVRALGADLGLMAYVTLFVPRQVLSAPRLGTIQYHPSLLPRHRGPSSINWPIIQGETSTGLSIFWPDEGLDEGPVLLQRTVPIRDDDTLGSLYFERLFPMGVEAMCEAVALVERGDAPRIEQDHALATYEGWCRDADARVDWSAPVDTVWNLIRGTNPQPGAWTTHGDRVLRLFDCVPAAEAAEAPPGTVLAVEEDGVLVAARNGSIKVQRVRVDGGREKVAAAGLGLVAGDRLGGP